MALSEKNTHSTRLGYAASDMAGQLIFHVVSIYILFFYTDALGISPIAAGWIVLIARLEDALDTPIWGILLDKTKSKYGKSRPWFLWLCLPFALFGILAFLSPDWGERAKIIYAGATYIVLGSLYTGINTPVTSILPSLTSSSRERINLTTFRMVGSKIGVLIVSFAFLPLVKEFGNVDERGNEGLQDGFMMTMPIFAVCSVALYLVAFSTLRERVTSGRERIPIKRSFRAFKGNWPWIIIFLSSLCFWVAFIARFSTASYFFIYVWENEGLLPWVFGLDAVSLAAIFLIPLFCSWANKTRVWLLGLAGSVLAQFIIYAGMATQSLPLLLGGWIFGILASGVAMTLPFSLLADAVDYGEWKAGVRSEGLLTAIGTAFCLKAGSGLGGALPAWVLGWTGYVANQEQTDLAIAGINFGFIWIPAIFYGLALLPVLFYGKYESMEPQVQEELQQRRDEMNATPIAPPESE